MYLATNVFVSSLAGSPVVKCTSPIEDGVFIIGLVPLHFNSDNVLETFIRERRKRRKVIGNFL